MQNARCGPCLGGQRPPVQLLKAESAGIVIVDFQYRRLQESPGVLCRATRSPVRAARKHRRLPFAASRTRCCRMGCSRPRMAWAAMTQLRCRRARTSPLWVHLQRMFERLDFELRSRVSAVCHVKEPNRRPVARSRRTQAVNSYRSDAASHSILLINSHHLLVLQVAATSNRADAT